MKQEPSSSLSRMDGTTIHFPSKNTLVMGILNLTPDSFSDGGKFTNADRAWAHLQNMLEQGADIIDVGAESTRPQAEEVSPQEEWQRLEHVLMRMHRENIHAIVSVDTRHVETAKAAATLGVNILNLPFPNEFIQKLEHHHDAADILAAFDAVILMHSRGTPKTMLSMNEYSEDLTSDVISELKQTKAIVEPFFLKKQPLFIFDPGLGFAKTGAQNLDILANVSKLRHQLQNPLLIGASRKSFLGHITGLDVKERLAPSVAAALWAAHQGVAIVRVHDVKETRAALILWEQLHLRQEPAAPLLCKPQKNPE